MGTMDSGIPTAQAILTPHSFIVPGGLRNLPPPFLPSRKRQDQANEIEKVPSGFLAARVPDTSFTSARLGSVMRRT